MKKSEWTKLLNEAVTKQREEQLSYVQNLKQAVKELEGELESESYELVSKHIQTIFECARVLTAYEGVTVGLEALIKEPPPGVVTNE